MRRWVLGLLIFLFLSLTLFSLILGKQIKEIDKKQLSFSPTSTAASQVRGIER